MLKPFGVLSLGLSACLLPTFSEPNPETGGGGSTSTTGGSPNGGSATGGSSSGGSSTGGGGADMCEVVPENGRTATFIATHDGDADHARITHVLPILNGTGVAAGFFIVGVFEGNVDFGNQVALQTEVSFGDRPSKDVFVARLDLDEDGLTFTTAWARKVSAPNGTTRTNSVEPVTDGLVVVLGLEGPPTVASRSPSGLDDLALQTLEPEGPPLLTPTSALVHYAAGGDIADAAIFQDGGVKAFGFAPIGPGGTPRVTAFNGGESFRFSYWHPNQPGWQGSPTSIARTAEKQPVFLRYLGLANSEAFEMVSAWGEGSNPRGTRPFHVFGPGPSAGARLITLGGFDGGTDETQTALPLPTVGVCNNEDAPLPSCPGSQLFIGSESLSDPKSQPRLFDFGAKNHHEQLLSVDRIPGTDEFIVVAHIFQDALVATPAEKVHEVDFNAGTHEYFVARVQAPDPNAVQNNLIKWLHPIRTGTSYINTNPTVLTRVSVRPSRTGPGGDEYEVLLSLVDNRSGSLILGTGGETGWIEPATDAQTHWLVLDAGSGNYKCSMSAGQRIPVDQNEDRVDLGLEALAVPGGTVFFGRVQSSLATGEPAFLTGIGDIGDTLDRQRPLLVYVADP